MDAKQRRAKLIVLISKNASNENEKTRAGTHEIFIRVLDTKKCRLLRTKLPKAFNRHNRRHF